MRDEMKRGAGQGTPIQNSQIHDAILAHVLDGIKQRVTAGETSAPSDFSPALRPTFWAAIALLQNEFPRLKPTWRTLDEDHVDGTRLRERIFRMRGSVDVTLAAWLLVVAVSIGVAIRGCV